MRVFVVAVAMLLSAAVLAADDHTVLFDEDVNFATFKTFSVQAGKMTSQQPQLKYPAVMVSLGEAIRVALSTRGLKETDKADLDVEFSVSAVDWVVGPYGRAYPVPPPGRGRSVVIAPIDFTEATLVVDMRRTSDRELVWRGVYRNEEKDTVKLAEALPRNAAQLLSQYPPRRKG